ncbi:cytochrome P450 [Mycena galericulata]|nr:cytochrome P450 [Mycena galericulata]
MDPTTLAIGAFVVLALSFAIYQVGKPTPLPLIPHNKLEWFTGDIPFLAQQAKEKGSPTFAFDDTAMRLGPVSQVIIGLGASWASRLFGFGRVIVILADSQEIQDVLVNRAAAFARSKLTIALFEATVPHGMIALPTNDECKHHKRYLGITMTNPYLARMTPRMVDVIQELVDLWAVASKRLGAGPDVAINVYADIRFATMDAIASITFGASFNGIKTSLDYLEANSSAGPSARPEVPKLVSDLEVLLDTIGDGALFPAPSFLPWLTRNFNRKWRNALTSTHQFLKSRLYAARANYGLYANDADRPAASAADNVLDMILEKEKEDQLRGAEALTEADIIDELLVFVLGGYDTTATTIQWGVKLLCKHPLVQHKLRAELLNNLPGIETRPPTFAEISDESKVPYLTAVIHEMLRCSRTASAVARDTTCDTVLLGYPIPKGTQVLMPIGMVQQLESDGSKDVTDGLDTMRSASSQRGRKTGYWSSSDVHLFNPERWLTPDGSFDANAGPYMPFSFGFRGCFGQKLALTELRLFIAMMQLNFFFDVVPEELNSWRAHETVTFHPIECYARPVPWDDMDKHSALP